MAGFAAPAACRVRVPVRYACTSACAGVILLGSSASSAQIAPPPNLNRAVNLNYVYAAELGFGGYSLRGLTAQVYTLPLDYTWQDVLRDGWALKILTPIQLGLYSLKVTDTNGERGRYRQPEFLCFSGWREGGLAVADGCHDDLGWRCDHLCR